MAAMHIQGFVPRAVLLLVLATEGGARAAQTPAERLRMIAAEEYGMNAASDAWPDWSLESFKAAEARDRDALATLRSIPRQKLRLDERTTYDLIERELNRRLEQFRLRLYLTPWFEDPRFTPTPFGLAGDLGSQRPKTVDEAERLLRRLDTAPDYIEQVIAALREAIKVQMLPPQGIARSMARGIEALGQREPRVLVFRLNPRSPAGGPTRESSESALYRAFQSLTKVPIDDTIRIQQQARAAIHDRADPAIKALRNFIVNEYLPACPQTDSLLKSSQLGAEVYRQIVRRVTGTDMDPEQIHELGLREVARIRTDIGSLAAKMGHKGSVNEFLEGMNSDEKMYFTSADELLAAYRAATSRIEAALPKIVHTFPSVKLGVKTTRLGGAAAMYQPPTEAQEAGVLVVEVSQLAIRPRFDVLTLAMHEGVSGHHLQLALAEKPRSDAERLMRQSAFLEGWALYAETLGDELGLYDNLFEKFGQLSWELMRAVRMVVDSGVHARGWSIEEAKKYFMLQTGRPQAMADLEASRALWPGMSLTYKVGELRIRAMRARAAGILGKEFDIRNFHGCLLRWNPLPLDVLERKLDECLNDRGCSAQLRRSTSD